MTLDPIDHHLDKVLRAAGSGLRHYTMQSTLKAMRSAMSEAMAAGGWQPIETAPNETQVLLGWQDTRSGKWECQSGFASGGKLYPNGYSTRWWHGQATHWRPLPPPPAEGE